jgi:integrase
MDLFDLAQLTENNIRRGRIIFTRGKGGANQSNLELSVKIFPKAQIILDKYIADSRTKKRKYILPILKSGYTTTEDQRKYEQQRDIINKWLRKIGEFLKFDTRITTKVTRHTFATLARYKRVDFEIIQQMLGHSRGSVTDTYLAKFSDADIDQAHALVIGEEY